jgi:hypothetical protein
MMDFEPFDSRGEFCHPRGMVSGREMRCPNAGKCFITGDTEIVPFVPKSLRRNIKRISKFRSP